MRSGNTSIRRAGSSIAAFAASANSALVTVHHGLGKRPSSVQITPETGTAYSVPFVEKLTDQTFSVWMRDADNVARTSTERFYWTAEA